MSVRPRTRKDGTRGWEVRWRENGANRSRMFALKKDADAWDREVQRRKQLGPLAVQQLTVRGDPTLGRWVTERWAPEHAVMLADSTRDRYAEVYGVHIAPWLDDVPLGSSAPRCCPDGRPRSSRPASVPACSTRRARCSQASCATLPRTVRSWLTRCRSYAPRARRHPMRCNRSHPP
jgi:hypothetical protein